MRKNLYQFILAIVCCVCLSLGVAACSSSGGGQTSHTHEMVHYEAVEATDTEEGNIEYWYCPGCGKYFSDENGNNEISADSIVIEATGSGGGQTSHIHEIVHYEAVEATETEDGNIEYWYCPGCGKYFSDENGNNEISADSIVIEATGSGGGLTSHTHELTRYERVEATCTEDGNIEYWYCADCGKYFSDAGATTEISLSSTVITAGGHSYEDGVCTVCGYEEGTSAGLSYTLSPDGTYYTVSGIGSCTDTTLIIPSTYNFKPVTAIAANAFKGNTSIIVVIISDSVTAIGSYAFSGCSSLSGLTIGAGVETIGEGAFYGCGSLEELSIPASVTSVGANAFAYCDKLVIVIILGNPEIDGGAFTGCDKITDLTLSDELLKNLYQIVIVVFADSTSLTEVNSTEGEIYHAHELTHISKVDAACTEDGNIEYWYCETCGTYYSDQYGFVEISQQDTIINSTGHSYVAIVTAPTCTDQGYTTYICSCGDSSYVEDYVDALGHTAAEAVKENITEATYTSEGSYDLVVYCSVCGEVLSRETIIVPMLKHNYVATVIEPTCTEQGYTIYECSDPDCDDYYITDYVDALGHNWDEGEVITETTCTTDGKIKYTCTVCSEERIEVIPATGHTESEAVIENLVEATYTTDGSYDLVVYCSVCGAELSRETIRIPALKHNYVATVVEPTCTDQGYTIYECSDPDCDDYYITDYVDALGHSWDEGEVTTEATCTEYGEITYTCTVCGEEHTAVTPVKGHDYELSGWTWSEYSSAVAVFVCANDGAHTQEITAAITSVVITEATCIQAGEITYTATVIFENVTYTDTKTEIIPAAGHTEGEAVKENIVEATCTTDGSYDIVIYCSVCGAELSRETIVIPATGHNYVATVTDPTCTEQGYTTYVCSDCDDTYVDDYVEATGHDYKLSGWTWNGYGSAVALFVCASDGDHTYEVIAAITNVVTTEATCTETGIRTYTATITFENLTYTDTSTEVILAAGHSYEATVTEPTCTEQGYTTHICSDCGDSYVDNYVAATGHDYKLSGWTWSGYSSAVALFVCANDSAHTQQITADITSEVTTEATCTETGIRTYTATVTFENVTYTDTKTEIIPATGHSESEAVTENYLAATCTADGSYDLVVYCSVCNEELSRETIVIPALGHNAETYTYDNCYHDYVCTRCGETITEEHEFEDKTCTQCGYVADYSLGLEYTLSDDGTYYIVSGIGTCTDTEIIIPSIYKRLPVTAIGESAFKNCDALISVFVPDSITSIGASSLYNCAAEIIWGDSPSITEIGDEAFYCYAGTSITIPDSVQSIGTSAFADSSLVSVIIPDSVTTVGSRAFSGCASLVSLTIGEGVTSIDYYAFGGCTALTEVNYNAVTLTSDVGTTSNIFGNAGKNSGGFALTIGAKVTSIAAYLFYSAGGSPINLTSLVFESGSVCASIGANAFYDCTSLESVIISDSVTSIGNYAFLGCTSLKSLTLGKGLTSVGVRAFDGCKALTEINYNAVALGDISSGNEIFQTAGSSGAGITLTIGADVTYISACVFYSLSESSAPYIKEVIFEEGSVCAYIGNYAFANCIKLESITLPDSVTSIGDYAFYNCSSLVNLVISDNVTSIGGYAFYGGTSLTSITIPEKVTTIGSHAFYDCTALTEINYNAAAVADFETSNYVFCRAGRSGDGITVNIGASVTKIPAYMFDPFPSSGYSPKITSVIFAEGSVCGSIGEYAFYYNTSLTSITIPENVTAIGNYAFGYCTALTAINYNAVAVADLSEKNGIFYNAGADGDGITLTIGSGVTTIPAYLFNPYSSSSYSPKITSVVFAEGSVCQSIGASAFAYCYSIESVYYGGTASQWAGISFGNISSNPLFNGSTLYIGGALAADITIEGITSVNAYAFYNCTSLESVTIGGDVASVGTYAFYGCTSLESVTIGDDVASVGTYAFYNCDSLKNLTIGEGVETIGICAFYNCTALVAINFNAVAMADLASGNSVFYCAGQSGEGITVTIGANVTAIPAYLFYPNKTSNLPKITGVEFKDNSACTSIGTYAFYGAGITSITIPEKVTKIGDYAFYNCTALTAINFNAAAMTDLASANNVFYCAGQSGDGITVTIGASVTAIPAYLFYPYSTSGYLPNITSVVFEDNSTCTSIGEHAFAYCSSLTGLYITDIAAWCNISFTSYSENILRYAGNLYVNNQLVTELVIPDSVTSIGSYAFAGCTSITNLTIGENVTSIGNYAFYNCTTLTAINYNAVAMDDLASYNYVLTGAGKNGNGITVTIGASVTKIPAYLFYPSYIDYVPNITSVVFEDGSACESIGTYAFAYCSSLTSITIPENVTTIGSNAFAACMVLTEIYFNATAMNDLSSSNYVFYSAGKGGKGITVTIGAGVTKIPAYLFTPYSSASYSPKIISVVFEDGSACTSIGAYSFEYGAYLISITIPESVTSIGSYAFYYCYKLIEVCNFSSLTVSTRSSSNGYVAYYAKNVYTAASGASCLIYDGDYVFYNDNGTYYLVGYLGEETDITLPDSVNGSSYSIYDYAFYGCSTITSITISDGVTSIGKYAFYNCTSLGSITISSSVTAIDDDAFAGCSSLVNVYYGGSVSQWAGISFRTKSSNPLYYAENLYIDGNLVTDITLDDIDAVSEYAFYGYVSLTSVTIGGSVTTIGDYAFYGCTSLESVTIGDSVTTISYNVFSGCTSLESITIGSGITTINSGAFDNTGYYNNEDNWEDLALYIGSNLISVDSSISGSYTIKDGTKVIAGKAFDTCKSLTSLVIPDSVLYISSQAIYYCTSLTSITIGEGVLSIGSNAFYQLTALTEINYNAAAVDDLTAKSNVFYYAGRSGEGVTVTIGANVTKIPAYLFYDLNKITSVIFDENSACESIGNYAFANCTSITTITIPDSVTSIGIYALANCTSLESISIGKNVTEIGNYAFYRDTALTSVVIPDSVTTIGTYAFSDCTSLASLTIGEGVTSIGNYAFNGSTALTEIYYNAAAAEDLSSRNYVFYNAGQSGDGITMTIGASVKTIPACLFYTYYSSSSLPKITSVIFESGTICESIGNYAFSSCTLLESVYYGGTVSQWASISFGNGTANPLYYAESLYIGGELVTDVTLEGTSVGTYAFYGYASLASVTIGDSVTSVGGYAFYDCTSITSLTIGEGVATIGDYAFYNCTALTEINFNAAAMDDLALNNYVFYNAGNDGDGIAVTIGAAVTTVPGYLFYPCYSDNTFKVTSVEFASGSVCTSIGAHAFGNCSLITSIVVPDSVTTIGSAAFSGCSGLVSITLPFAGGSAYATEASETTLFGYIFGSDSYTGGTSARQHYYEGTTNDYVLYYIPSTLATVTITGGEILYGAFYNCSSITSITISGNITSIGSCAFYNCTSLASITIGSGVTTIGGSAFYNCSALTEIYFNATAMNDLSSGNSVFNNAGKSGGITVTIGANVTKIPAYLFGSSTYITDVEFASGSVCTSIGSYAFDGCTALKAINMPENVTAINDHAFNGCTALTSITIPEKVTSVGSYAFNGCTALTEINFNAAAMDDLDINNYVFNNAGKSGSGIVMTVGASVTKIPAYLFHSTYSSGTAANITSVEFASGSICASIGNYVFYNCTSLKTINIPDSVTTIGSYAFYGCTSLTSVTIPKNVTVINDYTFSGCTSLTSVTMSENVTTIGSYAFNGCTALTTVNMPESLTAISDHAFYDCTSLTSLTIPENVTTIGNYAFYNCTALMEINFNATAMGDLATSNYVFAYAGQSGDGIAVTIGDGITTIPANLFAPYNLSGCEPKIISVTIPESVTAINSSAFYGCTSLKAVYYGGTATQWASITFSDVYSNPLYYAGNLYLNGVLATEITLEGITEIKKYAFDGCTSLTSLTIGESVTTIGRYAFAGCTSITEINFNATAMSDLASNNYVFSNVGKNGSGVTVNIGANVTAIPAYLFNPYSSSTAPNVTKVVFETGSVCTSIGNYAFYYCTALTEIVFNAVAMNDLSADNEIFSYAGHDGDGIAVTIGAGVTKIPAYLFDSASASSSAPKIKSVVFEDGSVCESIGAYSFYYCTLITSITIPEKVTSIGNYAFGYCNALTEINFNATAMNDLTSGSHVFQNAGQSGDGITVTIGANVTKIPAYLFVPYANSTTPKVIYVEFAEGSVCQSIGGHAFYYVESLISVSLPASVTEIGTAAFAGCSSLESVNYGGTASQWASIAFSDGTANLLYNGCGLYIGGTLVTEITLEGITSVSAYAFYGYTLLTSLTIGESVASLGSYAFDGCTALTEINFNATAMNDLTASNYVFQNAGQSGDGIKVTIGANVTKIPAYLFYPYSNSSSYAPKITSIEFVENSVCTSIGSYAFAYCADLTEIIFNVTAMDDFTTNNYKFHNAGSDGSGIKVTIGANVTKIPAYMFYGMSNITSVEFASGSICTSIGACAFCNCTSLTSVTIPESITSIGDDAFKTCSALTEINFNAISMEDLVSDNDVFNGAGQNSDGITLNIGAGVTKIPAYLFYFKSSYGAAPNITSVVFASGSVCGSIGTYAFYGCTSLKAINLPEKVTTVSDYTFYGCTSLSSVTMTESVTSIGSYAFYGCTSLVSITIPEGIISLGLYAFADCTALTEINFNATAMDDLSSFNYVFNFAGQSGDGIIVTIGANVTKIPAFLFDSSSQSANAPKITSVIFEEGSICKSIGKDAFACCASLISMAIPESVTSIGSYAFYKCTALISITIPENVTSIGNYAFYNCTALTAINFNVAAMDDLSSSNNVFYCAGQSGDGITVTIGANVTKIPAYLFYPLSTSGYSPKITSVVFESGSVCESIGTDAFYYCSSLESVYYYGTASQWASITFENNMANPLYYAGSLYLNGTFAADITLENITAINAYAFYGCTSLESVTIGSSVTSLDSYAFYGCTSLENVTIGSNVTSLGNYAFYNCTALTAINFNAAAMDDLDSNNYVFTYAGQSGDGITVTIGANVTKIPAYLFYPYLSSSFAPEITSIVFAEGCVCESIGTYAFAYCNSLTSIVIPNSVKSIGSGAFACCNSLVSITLPFVGGSADATEASASTLFGYIFGNLSHNGTKQYYSSSGSATYSIPGTLTTVTITGGEILYGAFYGCSSLTSITLPGSLTSIGSFAFNSCSSLAGVYYSGTASQWASISFGNTWANPLYYAGSLYLDGTLATDITLEGITTINAYAFCGCTSLISITIPEDVISIGNYAFYNCKALTEINFNAAAMEDLSSRNEVFYNAGQSGDGIIVTIGATVTKIPAYLFDPYSSSSYSPKITSVVFESGSVCESIGNYAFYYCSSLESVYYYGTASQWASISFSDGYSNPLYYAGSLYLDGILATDITLENITAINAYAFYGCAYLESVTIGSSVTSLGNYAFYNCTALTAINFNATAMDDLSSSNNVFYCAGQSGDGIIVTIGANVTKIPAYLFYPYSSGGYSPKITSVAFENGGVCESIGANAFAYCTSLISIAIPEDVISIGNNAFYNCTALTAINFNATAMNDLSSYNNVFYCVGQSGEGITVTIGANVKGIPAYLFYPYTSSSYSPKITSVVFESGSVCVSIGNYAFYGCTSLIGITIPESITSIGNYAFNSCYKLIEVYNLSTLTITAGSTSNGYVAYNAKNVYTATDGASCLIYEDDYIFYNDGGTYYLVGYIGSDTELTLPDFTDSEGNEISYSIYQYSFYCNTIITSVVIPDSVTSIGSYAFGYCSSLTSVTIGDGVTNIDDFVFSNCRLLTSVTIGKSVATIESYAFYCCFSLESVIYSGTASQWASISFGNTDANPLYYAGSLYLNGTLATDITLENITDINNYAFYGCTSLTSVIIDDSVTTIGSYAFYGCAALTSMTMGNSVTTIGDNAFYGCTLLESITIPDAVTIIGNNVFYGCTALTSVTMGNNVTTIGDNAFYGCTALESITIPETVTSIGENAFYNTGYYKNEDNWEDLVLYLGNNLIAADTSISGSYTIKDGTKVIAGRAFYNCTLLTGITIPEEVVFIGTYAFYNCTALTAINFNAAAMDDLSSSNNVFYKAGQSGDGITVTIGVSVTKIPAYLFYSGSSSSNVPKITSVVFDDGCVCGSIGSYAFYYCSSLTSIIIPDSVTSIESYAFQYCSSLSGVYYGGTTDEWSAISFGNTYSNPENLGATIYYYSESEPDYTDGYNYWHYVDGEIVVW